MHRTTSKHTQSQMISLRFVILIFICWVMICCGENDIISPCGWRLCRDLCDSQSTCSSPDYRVETLSCVLRNGSLGVCQERVRECRTLTSRRGDNVTVCTLDVVKVKGFKGVDINSLKEGTPVLMSNNLYGLYTGLHKVFFMNKHHKMKHLKVDDSGIKSVMAYDPGTLKVVDHKDRLTYALGVMMTYYMPKWKTCDHLDLVTLCLTEKTFKEAQTFGFKIKG